jgi:hypothetical protein
MKETYLTGEPEFVKMYLKDISRLWDLDSTCQKLFGELLKYIDPRPTGLHNIIKINRADKKAIGENIGWIGNNENNTPKWYKINEYLNRLCKKGIIKKLAEDIFIIDSFICTKTDWKNTETMRGIQLNITYEKSSRSIITVINSIGDNYEDMQNDISNNEDNYKLTAGIK